MTEYDRKFALPAVFPPGGVHRASRRELANAGLRNLRLAETEKYAHVTYFFNCGIEKPYAGRRPAPDSLAASGHLRSRAGDERRGIRDALVADLAARGTTSSSATSPMPTWSGTQETWRRRLAPWRFSINASAGSSRRRCRRTVTRRGHRRSRQLRADVGCRTRLAAHRTYQQPRSRDPDKQGHQKPAAGRGALCDVAPTMLELLQMQQPKEMTGAIAARGLARWPARP